MGASATSPFGHRFVNRDVTETTGNVNIYDRSKVGRTGFKGAGTTEWLTAEVHCVPSQPNSAIVLPDNTLIARLGREEYFVLDGIAGISRSAALDSRWQAQNRQGRNQNGYPLPCADSHSWLYLAGDCTPGMMAKICAVNLHPGTFSPGDVVQTMAAQINAVLIRDFAEATYGLHMLTDVAFADYLGDVLEDAAAEFGGGFVNAANA